MRILLINLFVIGLVFSVTSCKSASKTATKEASKEVEKVMSPEEKMYAEMATEMCVCLQGIMQMSKEMEESEPDDMVNFMAMMQEEAASAEVCIEALRTKYPDIDFDSSNNPKAEKALMENCKEYKEMADKQAAKKEEK